MEKHSLNFGWEYTDSFFDGFASGAPCGTENVDIPHTTATTPFNYFDESVYQKVCGYRKTIHIPEKWRGRRVFLNVGAAAHAATVYVNGKEAATHLGGYTEFRTELTGYIEAGNDATIAVKVDSRETLDIPPFGNVVDYMTYGGIYREVTLEVAGETYIEDLFVTSEASSVSDLNATFDGKVVCRLTVDGPAADGVRVTVCGVTNEFPFSETVSVTVTDAKLWDPSSPVLYNAEVSLIKGEKVIDTASVKFGFRRAEFKADGFYINGRKMKLFGLNRHQSFPYVGYAMPRSAQRLDAEILKRELGVNVVRTSHYPVSHHFLDRCDELGLLVITEIPGWQHIGGEEWKKVAVRNTSEMVTQYRNHPSVILWGVRINESLDDDELYERTNAVCRALDPTRQTGGVRRLKKGNLLEDVFTYNDFNYDGKARCCLKKRDVTSDMSKGYLITEFNGHMFPTKTYDSEEHRLEHALRHAAVQDAVAGEDDIAGALGWCMFDYNTHRDFGSGDRICYHGVTDMFRNPKTAAYVYSVMQDETPVLEVSSSFDIGEHPAGNRARTFIFTNADSVKMYKNGKFIREFTHRDSPFKNLHRPPIEIDDYVGDQIANGENFKPRQAKTVKELLNYSARFGFSSLPLKLKLGAALLMLVYRMNFSDMYDLYGKYIGNWGESYTTFRFDAIKDGKMVKSVTKSPSEGVRLKVTVDHTELVERDTYDVATVRIHAVDQNGNVLPFFNESVDLSPEGAIEIIGPGRATLRGGLGGTYVRTLGEPGAASLTLTLPGAGSEKIDFTIKIDRLV